MAWLPEVMQDVADKIIADDWFYRKSPDGSQSYYVIGAKAYGDDVETGFSYTECWVQIGRKIGPLAEHVVRSQVAGSRRENYLKRERKRLERAGAPPAAIDRLIGGDLDGLAGLLPASMPPEKRVELLMPFLEALRVSWGVVGLDQEEAEEVDAARAKLCLREVVKKYGKIMDKWEQLDPLSFDDPQFEEASKAYLYGFYRASVVLSASALEQQLKRATGVDRSPSYPELVEDAAAVLRMDLAWIAQAQRIFRVRNDVVHCNYEPSHDEAGEVLSNARGVLTSILAAGDGT